ncbi:MAG: NUDIX domain-containing protein [Pseudomonadota bacterium]
MAYSLAMTLWRPASGICVKALGLHWRGSRLLAAEVPDAAGRVAGVRPLGGTVEFGETARAAVVREFREELGITVTAKSQPMVMENLYVHEGAPGHEVLFLFEVAFPPGAFDGQSRLSFGEDNGIVCHAAWFDLDALDRPGGPALFPAGLKARLARARG